MRKYRRKTTTIRSDIYAKARAYCRDMGIFPVREWIDRLIEREIEDNARLRTVPVRIPADLHDKYRRRCRENGVSMCAAATEAVRRAVSGGSDGGA